LRNEQKRFLSKKAGTSDDEIFQVLAMDEAAVARTRKLTTTSI
jgi:hypothetical protein